MLAATALPVQTWTPQLGAVRVNEVARPGIAPEPGWVDRAGGAP